MPQLRCRVCFAKYSIQTAVFCKFQKKRERNSSFLERRLTDVCSNSFKSAHHALSDRSSSAGTGKELHCHWSVSLHLAQISKWYWRLLPRKYFNNWTTVEQIPLKIKWCIQQRPEHIYALSMALKNLHWWKYQSFSVRDGHVSTKSYFYCYLLRKFWSDLHSPLY